jgi:tetratricopeptide (TPR) repeat protein/serine/threonine protein kinase
MALDAQRVQAVFQAALEAPDPAARAAVLERECATDPEVSRRVQALLQAYENPASILDRPPLAAMPVTVDDAPPERPGTIVGSYKLIEQIGEGGMGAVWMAQQTEPVKRLVALKLIKAGMDSRQVIARFEAERQALALMDHPNIARVLDGGTTSAGRPYFVMDLVKGVPITRYCDEHRLTPRQRLELFLPVCQAVQHAHQKGIIHRDLKPSNVLVAQYDGKPVPKVIDFGVAKAAGQSLTDKTLVTGFGNIVGTLEYMSPEQAEVNQLDIDTRSDIYSLGVLLYELLAGSPPFTKKELEKAGMLEMLRVIREQEPSKPSTKLSSSDALPTLSANRGTEPAKLTRLVRGELDWIVMKALEKDRGRRYETANGFAMDVQRYLADEPVLACPPSVGYRLRKLIRRNKAGLAVAALVLFFLVLLGSGIGWAVRDREARAHEAAKERADRHAKLHEQVTRTLTEARDWLDRDRLPEAIAAVVRAETILAAGESDDAIQADVQQARQGVDLVTELDDIRYSPMIALQQYDSSVERNRLYEKLFGKLGVDVDALSTDEAAGRIVTHPLRLHLLAALDGWADMRHNILLVETHRGDAWWHRLLLIANQVDPDSVRQRVRTAVIQHDLKALDGLAASADVAQLPPATAGQLARALYWTNSPERQEAAVTVLKLVRMRHPDHFGLNMSLFNLLKGPGKYEEALSYLRAAEVLRPRTSLVHSAVGYVLSKLGRPAEAAVSLRKAIEVDPTNAVAHNEFGNFLHGQGKLDEAVPWYRRAIELDPQFALAHMNLGNVLSAKGQLEEGIGHLRKAIEFNPNYALAHFNLGVSLVKQKKFDDACDCHRKAIELDPGDARWHFGLGSALQARGKLEEAIACYKRATELDPKDVQAHSNLGVVLWRQGKLDDAIASYGTAIDLDPKCATPHNNLAWLLATRPNAQPRDFPRALELAKKAVDLAPKNSNYWRTLGMAQYRVGDWEAAVAALLKVKEVGSPGDSLEWFPLAMAYWRLGNKEEARKYYDRAVRWTEMNQPQDELRRRFRAEAEDVLGIKK